MEYFVYILKCSDQSLYTGITSNLNQRINAHSLGKGSKYTRARLPVELVYVEKGFTKGEALSREFNIKNLTKEQKLNLIFNYNPLQD